MGRTLNNQDGAVLVIFALLLVVLIGFVALAMEAGRWYLVRAELSKSVDAASLAGAKNISNPYLQGRLDQLCQDFGNENFQAGYEGTPASGTGAVAFTTVFDSAVHQMTVTGTVTSPSYLAQLFGVNQVDATASGAAKKNDVQIMLVLDRSGSMAGRPIADLKTAAASFVSFFQDTQSTDKMGLISFATGVSVDVALGTNYVIAMNNKINGMSAVGATNTEDALAQTMGPSGLTDQTGVPGDLRVQQFVILFTDGVPTAFRGKFKYQGTDNIDAVVAGIGQTCDTVYNRLGRPDVEADLNLNGATVDPEYTGDGKLPPPGSGTSKCSASAPGVWPPGTITPTTKWYVFSQYPVGYSDPEQCYIPYGNRQTLPLYICSTARQMTLDQAQALKNRYVKIYTIGLGQADKTLLHQVASGDAFEYYAPTSSDLQAIFNLIAKEIKLRLVQ